MIRHVVFFIAERPENIPAIVEGLAPLGTIEGARNFLVTENKRLDQLANEVDVVVYAEFDDAEALASYKAHPTYQDVTRRVRPLRRWRYAADTFVPEAGPHGATGEDVSRIVAAFAGR